MIRLTTIGRKPTRTTLKVEGWITGDDSNLLDAECNTLLKEGRQVQLDLSGVSFVDARGAAILRQLRCLNLEIVGCPSFILEFVNGGSSK